jgi:hypothetical protein
VWHDGSETDRSTSGRTRGQGDPSDAGWRPGARMTESDAPARLRLPDRALPVRADGAPVPLRQARHGTVLVLLGSSLESRDLAFVQALATHREALRAWDGRVLLIATDAHVPETAWPGEPPPALPVLVDVDGSVAAAADVKTPALVITDQYGEVYLRESITPERAWPTVESIEQWLRFLAIRCAG